MAKKSSSQLIVLSLLAIDSLALYLGYNLPNRWQYALENRALSLIAIVITGAAIALALRFLCLMHLIHHTSNRLIHDSLVR